MFNVIPVASKSMKQCHNQACTNTNPSDLKGCGKCKKVFYCSKDCQTQDWKTGGHQKLCITATPPNAKAVDLLAAGHLPTPKAVKDVGVSLLNPGRSNSIYSQKSHEYFCEQGKLHVETMSTFLKKEAASRGNLKHFFNNILLKSLGEARRSIALHNKTSDAQNFGSLRRGSCCCYHTSLTPLYQSQYSLYNEHMVPLAQANGGAGWEYKSWTVSDMYERNWIGHDSRIKKGLIGEDEDVASGLVARQRAAFTQQARRDILAEPGFLQVDAQRESAKTFATLFPLTHQKHQISNLLGAIGYCEKITYGGQPPFQYKNAIDARFHYIVGDRADRVIGCLNLSDPSAPTKFWIMEPKQAGGPPSIYLQHPSPLKSEEIMKEEVEPRFVQIIALKDRAKFDEGELKYLIGELVYHFAQAMPYSRGSAAINEWLESILYQFHELSFTPLPHTDLEAFIQSKDQFMKKYMATVTTCPLQ